MTWTRGPGFLLQECDLYIRLGSRNLTVTPADMPVWMGGFHKAHLDEEPQAVHDWLLTTKQSTPTTHMGNTNGLNKQ